MKIDNFGWSEHWKAVFTEWVRSNPEFKDLLPGRIVAENRGVYRVVTEGGEFRAETSGRMLHLAGERKDLPVAGDWVALRGNDQLLQILHVLPRKTALSRKAAGTIAEEQVVAANVDIIFIVCGLDHDFNLRRIERYLTLAYESGASPVIILNKSDLVENLHEYIVQTEEVAFGVPVLSMSASQREVPEEFYRCLKPQDTGVLVGSSGVGKSSIINALTGLDAVKTSEVRQDDSRGRHTTTNRQIYITPNGGLLIDTPGLREIQLIAEEDSLHLVFDDIARFGESCRYRDCSHAGEPGCAVQAAVAEGSITMERYESYLKQLREIRYQERQSNVHKKIEEKRRWKSIMKTMKHHYKYRKD